MNDLESDHEVLLPAKYVASMLQVSPRTLWRWLAAGKLITPVKVGGCVRWRKDELMRWIAAGCPPRLQENEGR